MNVRTTVYTIGHSNRSAAEFVQLLLANEIDTLVDIRTVPKSQHNPQYGKTNLERTLTRSGIQYIHEPLLGGLRRPRKDSPNAGWRNLSFRGYADYMATADFERGLSGLLETAARSRTVMMCAEAVPWRCHRSLVADALITRRCRVLHIVGKGKPRAHRKTPFLRVKRGVLTYPEDREIRPPLNPQ